MKIWLRTETTVAGETIYAYEVLSEPDGSSLPMPLKHGDVVELDGRSVRYISRRGPDGFLFEIDYKAPAVPRRGN